SSAPPSVSRSPGPSSEPPTISTAGSSPASALVPAPWWSRWLSRCSAAVARSRCSSPDRGLPSAPRSRRGRWCRRRRPRQARWTAPAADRRAAPAARAVARTLRTPAPRRPTAPRWTHGRRRHLGGRLVLGHRSRGLEVRAAARRRARLRDRVRGGAAAVPAPARRARAAAGAAVPGADGPRRRADAVPVALLRPVAGGGGVGRAGGGARPGRGAAADRAALAADARVRRALPAVPVGGQRRAGVLRLRLGVAAAGGRLPRGVPGLRRRRGADAGAARLLLAAAAGRARRGADQDARRPVLARPHVPVLPPRDPADAGPVLGLLPRAAEAVAQGGGRREPRRAARRTVPALRTATGRLGGGGARGRDAAVAGRVGQLRVAELADDAARVRGGLRRRAACGAAGPAGIAAERVGPGVVRRRRGRGDAARARAVVPAGAQPRVAAPEDERRLQPVAPRGRLRRVRLDHASPRRGRRRGQRGRRPRRRERLAGVRVQGQAGPGRPPAAAVGAVPPAAGLGHVVPRARLGRAARVVRAVPAAAAGGGPGGAAAAAPRP